MVVCKFHYILNHLIICYFKKKCKDISQTDINNEQALSWVQVNGFHQRHVTAICVFSIHSGGDCQGRVRKSKKVLPD